MHSFATCPLRSKTVIFPAKYHARKPRPAKDPEIGDENTNLRWYSHSAVKRISWGAKLKLNLGTWRKIDLCFSNNLDWFMVQKII